MNLENLDSDELRLLGYPPRSEPQSEAADLATVNVEELADLLGVSKSKVGDLAR
jgi:hypothetical protein